MTPEPLSYADMALFIVLVATIGGGIIWNWKR